MSKQLADEIEERGRSLGLQEGRAETVLRLLRLKYDQQVTPQIEAKVRQASSEQLDRYTERVLTQTTLQATLDDD